MVREIPKGQTRSKMEACGGGVGGGGWVGAGEAVRRVCFSLREFFDLRDTVWVWRIWVANLNFFLVNQSIGRK